MKEFILKALGLCSLFTSILLMPGSLHSQAVDEMAKNAASDVGTVLTHSTGSTKNAPIIVLDEVHNSRAAQIEQAITLVRMHELFGLRNIVLEGYLKSDSNIDSRWFDRAAGGDLTRKARVATQLLTEGEIGGAEFLTLAYGDVAIHPAEVSGDYRVELPEGAAAILRTYLLRMAEAKGATAAESLMEDLKAAGDRFNAVKNSGDQSKIEIARAEVADRLDKVVRALVAVDLWILDKYEALQTGQKKPSLTRDVELAREIKSEAAKRNIPLKPNERNAMDSYIAFHEARDRASLTMSEAAIGRAETRGGPVALIIGAGHTADVEEALRRREQTFAIVRPSTLSEGLPWAGDIGPEAFLRKEQGFSLFSEGISRLLVDEFGLSSRKKPQTVLNQPWFQAKAELYLLVDRVAGDMLGGPPPPRGPASGLVGAAGGDDPERLVGVWVAVERRRAVIAGEGEEGRFYALTEMSLAQLKVAGLDPDTLKDLERIKGHATESEETFLLWAAGVVGQDQTERIKRTLLSNTTFTGVPAVIMPVVLHHDKEERKKEIWVKAARRREAVSGSQRASVEAMLRQALMEVKSSKSTVRTKAEDPKGRVQITVETLATFASSEAEARSAVLSER